MANTTRGRRPGIEPLTALEIESLRVAIEQGQRPEVWGENLRTEAHPQGIKAGSLRWALLKSGHRVEIVTAYKLVPTAPQAGATA